MTVKYITITKCEDCPYRLQCTSYCIKEQSKVIDKLDTIPNWCQLPDSVSEGEVKIENCTWSDTDKRCDNCRHFHLCHAGVSGTCHRFPPVPLKSSRFAELPIVAIESCCGEFEKREG